jgi:DNA invertase Pin-like site-specific DNA recombinase
MNAAIYCRISEDKVGAGLGVTRQRDDCEELARRRGWEVVGVYVDNDVSAYSGKRRPEYRRLLADMKTGRIDAVIAWHTDRLHRSPRELEEFIDICEANNVHVETVRAGEIDLKTPAGRAVARTLGAWARYESEHKSERIARKHLELAKEGFAHSGGPRCYGYAKDKVTIVPEEAAVLREVADRVLAGETLRAICIDLNGRGLRTTRGNLWSTPRLRSLLLAPRMAALRAHPAAGIVPAKWPAIFSEDQHRRLEALLNDPTRRNNPGAPRRWLLSGILVCGECGTKLSGQRPLGKSRHGRTPQYRCSPQEHRGCSRVAISAHLIEPFLVESVLSVLETVRVGPSTSVEEDKSEIDALASDQQQLSELASMYGSRAITAQEWLRAKAEIDGRISERNQRVAKLTVNQKLGNLVAANGGSLRDSWPQLPLEQQRSIISSVLDSVTVNRAKTTRFFDPGRLVPVWRV